MIATWLAATDGPIKKIFKGEKQVQQRRQSLLLPALSPENSNRFPITSIKFSDDLLVLVVLYGYSHLQDVL